MKQAWLQLSAISRDYKISNLRTGDLIKLKSDVLPIIFHYGIVFEEDGQKFVYHNTPDYLNKKGGSIVREPLDKWLEGRDIISIEPTGLTSEKIHEIVKREHGKKYNFLNFNCEHFTNYIKEKQYISPQVAQWAIIAATVGITYLLVRKLK